MIVIETNMRDGVDLIHEWNTVDDAWKSGRLDYLSEQDWRDEEEMNELYSIQNLRELIEKIWDPFYIMESK